MKAFPQSGHARAEVLAALGDHRIHDLKADGSAFAFVYDAGPEIRELTREAFAACMPINALDPTVYPSARKIENGVVKACLELVHAPEGAVGTATAGGTESVLLAVKTARDHARKSRPAITRPKMLLPITAHACFHKAAHYFDVEVIPVEVDPITFRASIDDARAQMTSDVILVVGSAPSYAHGVIDPIADLAALAVEHGSLMHVDACVGGFVLPFLEDAPAFDFAIPGVTSMSMDLHKYGFAPKGISVLLQRDKSLRASQYFACASWTGYSIVNSTTLGSKSVAAMGAAYALIHHLGRDGYTSRARDMWAATLSLVRCVESLPGLRMLGKPDMNLFAFTTTDGDVFELSDRLLEHGWHVQPTYAFGPSPAHIHLTLDPGNAARAADFARDLAACMKDLPPRMVIPAEMLPASDDMEPAALMAAMGITDGKLPARAGMIHRLLDAAPPALREKLLVLFFGELYS